MKKELSTKQVAKLQGVCEQRIRAKLKHQESGRKIHFPNARKCECGHTWFIPERDVRGK